MRKTTLETLADGQGIYSNGTDVLIAGKYLHLFRADGTFVAKFQPIRHPLRVAFLPGRTALVEGSADEGYHYLSLESGTILWSCQQQGRSHISGPHCFALSSDGKFVYTLYYPKYEVMEVERICPTEQTYEKRRTKFCLRTTDAIFCDKDGTLCALQQHAVQRCDNLGIPLEPGYHQNGILPIPFDDREPYWIHQWRTDEPRRARACDGRYILYEDYSIWDLETDTWSRLISLEEYDPLPHRGFICHYNRERNLLTVRYIGSKMTVVIDCKTRRVTARYIPEESHYGFPGCLIGDEFWMGSKSGVQRLPYPMFQEGDPCIKSMFIV